uniref:hypothetical protein n=1 Tax=Cyanothece sp. BG0011 TaxID=2082950 RepID=UPI0030DC4088
MNNINDALQYVDNLIFEKTGRYLTSIQEAILTGVWQRQKYHQIAENFYCSESHVKKEAAKLWKQLGETLDEDINKNNLRSKLERKYRITQGDNFGYSVQFNEGNIHICDQILINDKKQTNSLRNNNQFQIIDLTKAPNLRCNYGRSLELSTLKEWIENKTRLI